VDFLKPFFKAGSSGLQLLLHKLFAKSYLIACSSTTSSAQLTVCLRDMHGASFLNRSY
jgi:hypothetical protein